MDEPIRLNPEAQKIIADIAITVMLRKLQREEAERQKASKKDR